jgi:hypothetical protein
MSTDDILLDYRLHIGEAEYATECKEISNRIL